MAAEEFEPFFFFTEGHGVCYLVNKTADYSEYGGQTYMATGSFQNINGVSDGKNVYLLDGRYYDQMNEASMVDCVMITDTVIHTLAKAKKFIKDQNIQGVDANSITLYQHEDTYWFVNDGVLDPYYSKKPKSKSAAKTRKK